MSEAPLNNPKFKKALELAKWALEKDDESLFEYVAQVMDACYRLGYIAATKKANGEVEKNA